MVRAAASDMKTHATIELKDKDLATKRRVLAAKLEDKAAELHAVLASHAHPYTPRLQALIA